MSAHSTESGIRPRIICHMVTSIDGRLLVDRWTRPAAGIDAGRLRGHYGARDERPAAGRSLRHLATDTFEGGMVWLRYRVETEPPSPDAPEQASVEHSANV